MDGTQDLDIGFQEVTVKNKRVQKARSKIFKKLLEILHFGKEKHVIWFTNEEKTEFEIKLIDKKNKKQWRETDISLFLALDSVSSKCREKEKLAEKTKGRFKSNMLKLQGAGYLKYLGSREMSKSVVYKKYRILKDCSIWDKSEEGYSLESTVTESKEGSEDLSSTLGSPFQNSCNFPSSHYSCLSGESSESDGYKSIVYGSEGSTNNLPVANKKVVKYIASETIPNISSLYHNVDKPNWNNNEHKNILCGIEGNIPQVVNEEVVGAKEEHIPGGVPQNLSILNPYVGEPNWNNNEYKDILCGNEENIPQVVNEEVIEAKEEHISGEVLLNLPIINPGVGELNWNNNEYKYVLCGNEENILQVVNEKVVEAKEEHISGVVLPYLPIVNLNVGELNWNNNEYKAFLCENEENTPQVVNEEILEAKEEHKSGEVLPNLPVANSDVGELNWNNNEYKALLCGNEGNIPQVVSEEVVGAKQEHIAGRVPQNLSILNLYVDEPNWNNNEYKDILCGNEENNPQVVNEEIVEAKEEHISGIVLLNLPIVNSGVGELNWNNNEYKALLCGNEGNIPQVVNEEVVGAKQEHIAGGVPQNLSILNIYVDEPNWNNNEYKDILCGNEENILQVLQVVNEEIVEAKEEHISGEGLPNLPIVNPDVGELNWNKRKLNFPDTQNKKCRELDWSPTKSNFDDSTMFEEGEDDDEILMDSTNPLLSSTVVTEERTGLNSDSKCNWENDFKTFSFDETMYDSE